MNYIFIFFSQSGAIMFKRQCDKQVINCKLSPTPRVLSSSCGTCATIEFDGDPLSLNTEEVESIYKIKSERNFELIFDNY